jgi:hypothetical protein
VDPNRIAASGSPDLNTMVSDVVVLPLVHVMVPATALQTVGLPSETANRQKGTDAWKLNSQDSIFNTGSPQSFLPCLPYGHLFQA